MRHNHLTRDIKPLGECEGCDQYREDGVHTLPSGDKVVVWRDREGKVHVNGTGALISPEGPQ